MFEAAIGVKSSRLIKSRLKTRKRENVKIKDTLHELLSKRLFWNGIQTCSRELML